VFLTFIIVSTFQNGTTVSSNSNVYQPSFLQEVSQNQQTKLFQTFEVERPTPQLRWAFSTLVRQARLNMTPGFKQLKTILQSSTLQYVDYFDCIKISETFWTWVRFSNEVWQPSVRNHYVVTIADICVSSSAVSVEKAE